MKNTTEGKISDEDANRMLDEILEEDKQEDDDDDDDDDCDKCESCAADCAQAHTKFCECLSIAENSSRFSLRVMEAMRCLQQEDDASIPTSSVEDIVNYIKANYRDDGDLYAQVRTVLKQVCSQGFVMELLKDEYYLIGPDAISMNQTTCSNVQKNCSLSSPPKTPKRRRKSNYEDCLCETPFKGSRKISRRRENKYEEDNETEEAPECSCSVILTEEDDDCPCEGEMHKSARVTSSRRRDTLQDVQENGDRQFSRESEATMKPQTNSYKRKYGQRSGRTTNVSDRRRIENEELNAQKSDNVDDIYQELQGLIPTGSKNHMREVKDWIKRCQEKCKQQGKSRGRNN